MNQSIKNRIVLSVPCLVALVWVFASIYFYELKASVYNQMMGYLTMLYYITFIIFWLYGSVPAIMEVKKFKRTDKLKNSDLFACYYYSWVHYFLYKQLNKNNYGKSGM